MGRRSLPKLDPAVKFQSHLGDVEELEAPFCPQSLFPQTADLEIEVGSGRKYARYAAYRLAQNDRDNARMIAGDGLKLFREFLPDESAVAVHVYFPDPWWKDRHRQRRVMQPAFIKDIERVLVPGGIFHFWTDVEQYFDETVGLMKEHSSLKGPHEVLERPAEHDMDYRTHFERRMRMRKHDVFRSQFSKE
jgi:tRNA (guanine-N7-)-methyltransferase